MTENKRIDSTRLAKSTPDDLQTILATTDNNLNRLRAWLAATLGTTLSAANYRIETAFDGMNDSKYFRITIGHETRIVIDAHTGAGATLGNYHRFQPVSALFRAAGVATPTVLIEDAASRYLIVTDLGAQTYLHAFNETNADLLLGDARHALIKWQLASKPNVLPACDAAHLRRELNQFSDAYIAQHLGVTLTAPQQQALAHIFSIIVEANVAQANVYVHRDYVPKNLLVSTPNPAVLGFERAMFGSISYDIASLYKDVDISWDEERVLDGTIRYWEAAKKANLPVPHDFGDFYRDVEWMGLQRHLSMMGQAANSAEGSGQTLQHLAQMPRLVRYIRKVGERYVALFPLIRLFDKLNISDGIKRTVGVSF